MCKRKDGSPFGFMDDQGYHCNVHGFGTTPCYKLHTPHRIQRKRTKGWKMPPNTVYVGRPTRFGNYLFRNDHPKTLQETVWAEDYGEVACEVAFQIFKDEILEVSNYREWIAPLVGKDLACWCALDHPCHADILLEIANE